MSIDKRFIRHYVIVGALVVLTSVTLFRYGRLAFGASGSQASTTARIVSIRGPIYDREGRLLAVDTDLYDVSIWKPSLSRGKEPEFAAALATAVGIPESEILE